MIKLNENDCLKVLEKVTFIDLAVSKCESTKINLTNNTKLRGKLQVFVKFRAVFYPKLFDRKFHY